MQNQKASYRYAKALFSIAKESMKQKIVLQDFNLIQAIINDSAELNQTLNSPTVAKEKKQSLIKKIFLSTLDSLTIDFLNLVIQKGRETLLGSIIEKYNQLYNKNNNIIVAQLISPGPLTPKQKEEIKSKISLTSKVELEEKINPDLIGGFIIKQGDKQYDNTIKKQINNVKRAFKL